MKKNRKMDTIENRDGAFLSSRGRKLLSDASDFATKEAYRTLRTNIRFTLNGEGCKTFCITSSTPGEGKSITIVNLAISFAEAGHRVLLVDADMRSPAIARLLVEKASPGLSNILAGIATTSEALRKDVFPNLDILFSGDIPPNASELLSSEQMSKLVEEMSRHYDYILVDTPPVNLVSDACVVANLLDGVLLLARQGHARKDGVKRAVSNLKLTGAKLLGCVFNGVVEEKQSDYGHYGRYGSYGG